MNKMVVLWKSNSIYTIVPYIYSLSSYVTFHWLTHFKILFLWTVYTTLSYSLFYVSDNVMGTSKEGISFYFRSFTYITHVAWMTINCLLFATFLNLLYIRIYKLANGEAAVGKLNI